MLFPHLLGPGDRVIVEQPSYDRTLLLLDSSESSSSVALEEDGLDVDALEAALAEGPMKLVHVIPNFHNPAGCTLSEAKRSGWSSWPRNTTSGSSRTTPTASCRSSDPRPRRCFPWIGPTGSSSFLVLEDGQPRRQGRLPGGSGGPRSRSWPSSPTRPTSRRTCSPSSIVLELCQSGALDRNIEVVKVPCGSAATHWSMPSESTCLRPSSSSPAAVTSSGPTSAKASTRSTCRRGQGGRRALRRRDRLHARGRQRQSAILLRFSPARPGRRGRGPHRPRARERMHCPSVV